MIGPEPWTIPQPPNVNPGYLSLIYLFLVPVALLGIPDIGHGILSSFSWDIVFLLVLLNAIEARLTTLENTYLFKLSIKQLPVSLAGTKSLAYT